MVIPYRIAKFKSANFFAMGIWGPTAKLSVFLAIWSLEYIRCVQNASAKLMYRAVAYNSNVHALFDDL